MAEAEAFYVTRVCVSVCVCVCFISRPSLGATDDSPGLVPRLGFVPRHPRLNASACRRPSIIFAVVPRSWSLATLLLTPCSECLPDDPSCVSSLFFLVHRVPSLTFPLSLSLSLWNSAINLATGFCAYDSLPGRNWMSVQWMWSDRMERNAVAGIWLSRWASFPWMPSLFQSPIIFYGSCLGFFFYSEKFSMYSQFLPWKIELAPFFTWFDTVLLVWNVNFITPSCKTTSASWTCAWTSSF